MSPLPQVTTVATGGLPGAAGVVMDGVRGVVDGVTQKLDMIGSKDLGGCTCAWLYVFMCPVTADYCWT